MAKKSIQPLCNHPDFVLGTGKLHRVNDILEEVFGKFNVLEDMQTIVSIEAPKQGSNNNGLASDTARVLAEIGWEATVSFKDIVKILVETRLGLRSNSYLFTH